jgi:LPPG:FO 2-phospho-L-lactate transferase
MKITALAGGVGGAKLADGLAQILPAEDLTIIVNTGDDFEHFNLNISPDLDTVCYTLAGLANPDTGWGRSGDTSHVMDNMRRLGGPVWFHLGDQDLATHLERTRLLREGQSLSQITHAFCQAWGVQHTILPMSDDLVRTMVDTEDGELSFQEYFVHHKCEPKVKGFHFAGINHAQPAPGVMEAIQRADGIVLCPSNPWVSIDPILALPGFQVALENKSVVAVSPIIGGHTVRGPAAKMYSELGFKPSALTVMRHYGEILTGFVLDETDSNCVQEIIIPSWVTNILMKDRADRRRLAQDVLHFIQTI